MLTHMSTLPPAGWYPDPSGHDQTRWWDGVAWSAHVHAVAAPTSLLPPPMLAPAAENKRRVPVWVWVLIALAAIVIGVILSPIFAVLALVVLVTGIVSLVKQTPTWLRFRNRKTATIVTAISAVVFLVTGSISSAMTGEPDEPAALVAPEPSATSVTTPEPTPSAVPEDEAELATFDGESSTFADTSVTSGRSALEVLESLPVKGRAAKTGYDRDEFGQRWLDIDRNGCDTRNDILAAQLERVVRAGPCKVTSGMLADPYTGQSIEFERGQETSTLVQIDHVVALADAWQKGAQQLTADQRATFANDPLNLIAADGSANAQKGAGDAATWLPSNKSFRCVYVARQVAVKATYGLWVTEAEHDAIERILIACPDEPSGTSSFAAIAPEPEPVVELAPKPEPVKPAPAPVPVAPAPAPPKPAPAPAPKDVFYQNCDAVRAAGAAPIHEGQPGYSRKLDRDGDGVGCE